MTTTTRTTTVTAPLSSTINTLQTAAIGATVAQSKPLPLRSAFSLAWWERLLGLVVAGGAWWGLSLAFHMDRQTDYAPHHIPAGLWIFLMANTLAVSALCARRALCRDITRGLSRVGYLALAGPIAQVAILLCGGAAGYFLVVPLFLALFAHFALSLVATIRAYNKEGEPGDFVALPLFFVWCSLLWFSQ